MTGEFQGQECGIYGGCENGKCVQSQDGFTCRCDAGYKLDDGIRSCVDIDECAEPGTPEPLCVNGNCVNLPGAYTCACTDGFLPSYNDPKACVSEEIVLDVEEN